MLTIQAMGEGFPDPYLIPITVHYGAGTDSNFDVYLAGHCQAIFSDLNFTDIFDNPLDAWLYDWSVADFCTYYVEIAHLEDNAVLYLYYGNVDDLTLEDTTDAFDYILEDLNVIIPMNEGSGALPHNYGLSSFGSSYYDHVTIGNPYEGYWVDDASPYHEPAYHFNETSHNNYAYFVDGTGSYFDFDANYSAFCWANVSTGYSHTAEFYYKNNCYQLEIVSPNDWLQTFIVDSGFTAYGAGYYSGDTDPDEWHHLGGAWNDTTQYLDIWRNGSVIVHANKPLASGIFVNQNNLYFGYLLEGFACWIIMSPNCLSTTDVSWLYDTDYYPQYSPLDEYAGFLGFRKYQYPEPSVGSWGSEETQEEEPEYATRGEILATAFVASLILIPLVILSLAVMRRRR